MATLSSPTCAACGAVAELADKFCEACGAAFADHRHVDLGGLAGVTDKGHRHDRNEDAMALTVTETPTGVASIAVVCDGVSTSERPDEASQAAAEVAAESAAAAMLAGAASEDALRQAVLAADAAVRDLAGDSDNAPATTIVAGVVSAHQVSVCWIGDSRAYWLPASDAPGALLLTRDDSLAEELVTVGVLTEAEAYASQHAHVVTRWLGADADSPEPHIVTIQPSTPGVLLLCSDGLWNYQPDPQGLHRLALSTALTDLGTAADVLLTFALDSGGQDNTTVVLAAVPPLARDTPDPGGNT